MANKEIYKKIDDLAKEEIKTLHTITINNLSGLTLRVYKRKGRTRSSKKIAPVMFIPPNIAKYLDKIETGSFSDPYLEYYEKKYGDITKNDLKNILLDFKTSEKEIDIAFYDNFKNKIYTRVRIQLPITLLGFIEKLFNHFDNVGLIGYPDNGGIDSIEYDKKNDIYLVHTWS
jgi:hypothetical protein